MSTDVLLLGIGVLFVVVILVLVVVVGTPTEAQMWVFRVVMALAAGAVGVALTGFLEIQGTLAGLSVRAGGALALFIFVYKINPAKLATREPAIIGGPGPVQTGDEKARNLAVEVLKHSYKRAFSMNYIGRFYDYKEYSQVAESVSETRRFLQVNMIYILDHYKEDKAVPDLVKDMLNQAEFIDHSLTKTDPYAKERLDIGQHNLLEGAPIEIIDLFSSMEKARMKFLEDVRSLAQKIGIDVSEVPATGP